MAEEVKKGDPTALGIFAYGFGLMMLSLYAIGAQPWGEHLAFAAPALVFSGLLLLVAANWEYNNGNTFGATAFGTYAGFFLTFGLITVFLWIGGIEDSWHPHLMGLVATSFIFMTLIYWIGSFKMTVVHNLMLFFLLIVFILWAIPLMSYNATTGLTAFGLSLGKSVVYAGYVGLVDVVFTTWLAAAAVINDRWEKAGFHGPIPLFPMGKNKKLAAGESIPRKA